MLEPGANVGGVKSDGYRPKDTVDVPLLPPIEVVVMQWVQQVGRMLEHQEDLSEQMWDIRHLFAELERVTRGSNHFIADMFSRAVSALETAQIAIKALSPVNGEPSPMKLHMLYGSVVTQWLDQLESNTGVIGCAEKELNVLGMLLADLRNKNQTPFTNRVFDRMHGTVYEANHLLTKHGYLVDEPHMFSATSDQSTKLVINPDWMDWITKRMEGQSDQFIMTTIKTAVMDEIRRHVLTSELLEIYHIEIEPVIASCTGSVTLERKDTGLNAVVSKYFKGQ